MVFLGTIKGQIQTATFGDSSTSTATYDHFTTQFVSAPSADSLLVIHRQSLALNPSLITQWKLLNGQMAHRPDSSGIWSTYSIPSFTFPGGSPRRAYRFPGKSSLMVELYNEALGRSLSCYRGAHLRIHGYSVIDSARYFSGHPVGFRSAGQYYSLERRTDSSGAFVRDARQKVRTFLALRQWRDGQKVQEVSVNLNRLKRQLDSLLRAQTAPSLSWHTYLMHASGPWLYFRASEDSTQQQKLLVYHQGQDSLHAIVAGEGDLRYHSDQSLFWYRPSQGQIQVVNQSLQSPLVYDLNPFLPTASPQGPAPLVWDYDYQQKRLWVLYGGIPAATYGPVADSTYPRGLLVFDNQAHLLHHFHLDTLAGYLSAESLLAQRGRVYFSFDDPRHMTTAYSLLGQVDSTFQLHLKRQVPFQPLNTYPHPASTYLTLRVSTPHAARMPYRLYGLTGQMYQQGQLSFSGGEATLDLHGLPKGSYILVLETGKKGYRTRVVVD